MAYPMFRNRLRPFDVPVRQSPAPPSAAPPSKVVSIPVHFVSSESKRSSAALRIQKAVRGFLVRKSVKKIVGIKKEVDEMEKRFFVEKETVDLIRKDGKERLRMNEMLMRLLFRLDSISGVDLGVRVLRKSVTRKVIMLQEKLDSIVVVTADENKESVGEENPMETQKSDMEFVGEPVGAEESELNSVSPNAKNCNEEEGGWVENEKSDFNNAGVGMEAEEKKEENPMETQKSDIIDMEVVVEPVGAEESAEEKKVDEDSVIACNQSQGTQEMEVTEEEQGDEKKALMEKMIEKNEMLIKMVSELCEKNRVQTEMLHSLSKRVDSLEKKQRSSKCKKRRQAPKNCYDA